MSVLQLHDEVALMTELCSNTVTLIHATTKIQAIKLLVTAHDIIELNLEIEKKFQPYKEHPPWDVCTLKELNSVRTQLLVFYRLDFSPFTLVDIYSNRLQNFNRIVEHRLAVAPL